MAVKSTGLSTKGLKAEFNDVYSQKAKASVWSQVAMTIQSDSDKETYKFLGSVPQVREFGAERQAKGLNALSYDVPNKKWENTIDVDRDEISDDQTGQIRLRINEMAARAASHKDELLGDLLDNGDQTGFNSYDGTTFFSTTHNTGDSGNQSNNANYDVSAESPDETDTTTAYSIATIQGAVSFTLGKMALFVDDAGLFLRPVQQNIIILCHPLKLWLFRKALNAQLVSTKTGGADSNTGVSPLAGTGGVPLVLPFPDVPSVSVFWTFDVSDPIKPIIFQDREPIEFGSLEGDSDEGFNREKYRFGTRARYEMTYGDWSRAFQTTFT